jgi:quercetin dioxygenase-like cupin family protein
MKSTANTFWERLMSYRKYLSVSNLVLLSVGILIGFSMNLSYTSNDNVKPVRNQEVTGVIADKIELNIFDLIKNGFQNDKVGIKWTVLAEDSTSGVELVSIKSKMSNHIHKTEDHYTYVISGNGEYIQSGKTINLEPGKFIFTPKSTAHEVINKGQEPLLFLVFSSPKPFREDDIEWIKNK